MAFSATETVDGFRMILDAAGDSILTCDERGAIQYANLTAEQFFGYGPHELNGLKIDRIMPHILLDGKKSNPVRYELVGQKNEGVTVDIEISVNRINCQDKRLYIVIVRDIALFKETYLALKTSETRYRAIFNTAVDGMIVIDDQGRIENFNPGAEKLFGYKAHEIIGNPVGMLMPEPDRSQHPQYIERYKRTGDAQIIGIGREVSGYRKDGSLLPLLLSVGETRVGERLFFTAILHDLSDLKETQKQLLEEKKLQKQLFAEKERLRVTLESIADAVITTDAYAVVDYLNPVAERLTGWTLDAATGQPFSKVFAILRQDNREPDSNPIDECLKKGRAVGPGNHTLLLSRNGKEYSIQDSAAPIFDRNGQLLGAILVFSDVTTQRQLTKKFAYQASHDPLTTLVNRREFEQRLQRVLNSAQTDNTEHALCYLDLDQFKVVNDTCGHVADDEILRQISSVIQKKIRRRDTLGRLGGDEFGIIMEHCTVEQAKLTAESVRKAVEAFRFTGIAKDFNIGVSIGVTTITKCDQRTSDLLMKADAACYAAKRGGRNRTHVYQANG